MKEKCHLRQIYNVLRSSELFSIKSIVEKLESIFDYDQNILY